MKPLQSYRNGLLTAGCDEAGRGCLAGPVFAAAVIFPEEYSNPRINDSKKIPEKLRCKLADEIKGDALAWGIASSTPEEIDRINILQASFLAMHRALDHLAPEPGFVIVDGNRFLQYKKIPYCCIVKGDSSYLAIAAASILAKTSRDSYMRQIADICPQYGWHANKGYPTPAHIRALQTYGPSRFHRRTFHVKNQLVFPFEENNP